MSEQKKQSEDELLEKVTSTEYKYGFTTDIESDTIPKGLSEDVVRIISAKKNEPEWMLEYRLKAYKSWLEMEEPDWANINYTKPNYQDVIYYSTAISILKKATNVFPLPTSPCKSLFICTFPCTSFRISFRTLFCAPVSSKGK